MIPSDRKKLRRIRKTLEFGVKSEIRSKMSQPRRGLSLVAQGEMGVIDLSFVICKPVVRLQVVTIQLFFG
jgi:hypothetical protein